MWNNGNERNNKWIMTKIWNEKKENNIWKYVKSRIMAKMWMNNRKNQWKCEDNETWMISKYGRMNMAMAIMNE